VIRLLFVFADFPLFNALPTDRVFLLADVFEQTKSRLGNFPKGCASRFIRPSFKRSAYG